MNRTVTIVMYHYVRDLERSRFPRIKGLSLARFKRQLDHILKGFTPVRVEDLMDAAEDKSRSLPENAILLTFDDGYSDHYLNVFPLLDAHGVQGCFFPSALAVRDRQVLDVNKIQFVLAVAENVQNLLTQALDIVDEFRAEYPLKPREDYVALEVEKHRYDPREIIVLKRLLQRELPEPVRAEVIRRLFSKYVTADETSFAAELYLSVEQMRCMDRHGMHFGSHGYSHLWMDSIPAEDQAKEVDSSLQFLNEAGIATDRWTMCYPYGGFNSETLSIVQERNARLGFGVEPRIANLDLDHLLALPRIDTNDLPS